MAGDPRMDATVSFVRALERGGADLIELGVPFSDPLADGPVIQRASERSLRGGTTLRSVLAGVRQLRRQSRIPLLLMTYYNPLAQYGEARFVRDALAAGVDGVIIPDLPPEEAGGLREAARREGLDLVFLLAPTSTEDRIHRVCRATRGFVYYVSLTGVTGMRRSLDPALMEGIQRLRKATRIPIAVGFGISSPDQAELAGRWADGVIVGSACVRLIERSRGARDAARRLQLFASRFRRALDR
jgi:tryptophan synthase alpha chain